MIERLFNFFKKVLASILTFLKVMVRSTYFPKKIKASSNELFILGNGPSLQDVLKSKKDLLADKTLLCVNKFPDTEYFEILKPKYFMICSPGYWSTTAVDYNVDVRSKIIVALVSKTMWPLTFLVPVGSKKNKIFTNKIKSNPNISIHYYNTTPLEGLDSISIWLMKNGLAIPRPHNVLVPSIYFAISSNYRNTYVLGADHSWLTQLSVNSNNEVLLNQKHFYDAESSIPKQMHKNDGHQQRRLHEVLEKFYFSFRSYHLLNKFAISSKVKVLNMTEGSFIDAFPKGKIDSIL